MGLAAAKEPEPTQISLNRGMRSYRCIGDDEATYKVGMNGFFKGFGSVVIGGFVGSCLAAASFLAIEAVIPQTSEAHPQVPSHQPVRVLLGQQRGHPVDQQLFK